MISTYRLLITAGPGVTKYNSRKVLYLVPRKQILRDQKPTPRSPQLPHIPVTAFSQTNLFLVWIYLKFRSSQESRWPTDHTRILGIGLEQACNGGSCGWISFTFEKTPREPHLQASSSPILGIRIWPVAIASTEKCWHADMMSACSREAVLFYPYRSVLM